MTSTDIKNLVYGFNDGLTANFGLMAGVIGAHASHGLLMTAAVSGAVANALSMASSSYLASKSEKEVKEYNDEHHESEVTPLQEGWMTGGATLVGSVIPLFPFFIMRGSQAMIFSFVVAMLSHFLIGAFRSKYTGKGFWQSGFEMFIVGFGVAFLGYFIGDWISGLL